MVRLVLIVLFLLVFFIVGIGMSILLFIIGLFNQKAKDYIAYYIVKGAFKIILFLAGTKVIVKGLENIPKNEAVLYVGNHRSFFDIVVGYSIIPPRCGFISKKEIKKVLPLSVWMYFMRCIFLDRSSIEAAIKMINTGVEHIKSGISIFIFPEGTRGKADDEMLEFKEGSFKIAKKAKCRIVPIAFNNTSAVLENQFPKIRKATVCVEFGKPIDIETLSKEEKKSLSTYSQNIVREMVSKNKELIKN